MIGNRENSLDIEKNRKLIAEELITLKKKHEH